MDIGRFETAIHLPDSGQQFPAAGGDVGYARLVTTGSEPLTLVEFTSEDREWVPSHSHPWEELIYVLDGELDFVVGSLSQRGGAGTIQALPKGVPHSLRVPQGSARFLMITLGAPSLPFLREVGQAYAGGPTLERLHEVAARHGVHPEQQPG